MLGSGIFVVGAMVTLSAAGSALAASAIPWAARGAQVVLLVAVVIFLWPNLKMFFTPGGE